MAWVGVTKSHSQSFGMAAKVGASPRRRRCSMTTFSSLRPRSGRGVRAAGGGESGVHGVILRRADDALFELGAKARHGQQQPGVLEVFHQSSCLRHGGQGETFGECLQGERLSGVRQQMQGECHQRPRGSQGMTRDDVALHDIAQKLAQKCGAMHGPAASAAAKPPRSKYCCKLSTPGCCAVSSRNSRYENGNTSCERCLPVSFEPGLRPSRLALEPVRQTRLPLSNRARTSC